MVEEGYTEIQVPEDSTWHGCRTAPAHSLRLELELELLLEVVEEDEQQQQRHHRILGD